MEVAMKAVVLLLALGVAAPALARPAPTTVADTASGRPFRSSCYLGLLGPGAGARELDCVITEAGEQPTGPSEAQVLLAPQTAAATGLEVVSGASHAPRRPASALELKVLIDAPPRPAAQHGGDVLMSAPLPQSGNLVVVAAGS
jgi:hypothetical protein